MQRRRIVSASSVAEPFTPRAPTASKALSPSRSFAQHCCVAFLCSALLTVLLTTLVLHNSGFFVSLQPHHSSSCRVVPGPVGAEDIQLDSFGVLFVSSDAREWFPNAKNEGFTGPEIAREKIAAMNEQQQGGVWAYEARGGNRTQQGRMAKLQINGLPDSLIDMHPHGLNIPKPIEGASASFPYDFLYVVNHARDGDEIIIFEIQYAFDDDDTERLNPLFPPSLLYRGLIASPSHFIGLNDLSALSPSVLPDGSVLHSVFASNFLGSALGHTSMNLFEIVAQRPWGSVVLCQATERTGAGSGSMETRCTDALGEKISGPNGVALSLNQRFIFVAQTFKMRLQVYALPSIAVAGKETWMHGSSPLSPLELIASIPIGSGVDNIDVDRLSGELLVGCHPKFLEFSAHQSDATHSAPTQIVRIKFDTDLFERMEQGKTAKRKPQENEQNPQLTLSHFSSSYLAPSSSPSVPFPYTLDEIHLSLGDQFSASSVGVWNRQQNQLIIGGVVQEGIFVCPYPEADQQQQ